jgi:C-terminal processing protease CtpA/Prc
MYQMLDEFDDGHIGLDAPEEVMETAEAMRDQLKAQNQAEEETTETPKKRLRNYQVAKEVALKYIPQGTFIKNGHLRWGSLEGNIGYLQVNQMMFVADVELSDTLSYRDYIMGYFELIENEGIDTPEEVAGLNNSLDIIMKDLGNSNALIIDLRFNGGGKDEVGMAILDRLNDTEREAFTKKGKLGNGFTPTNHVKQGATENAFTKPVYLLIATESASATEIMTLSSLSMPHVTRVGSRTEGVFSDILDRVLPNGWEFGLSSEVYLDNNGNNYEGVGIPPDVEIGYARDTQKFLHKVMDELNSTGDAAVEKALELIRN